MRVFAADRGPVASHTPATPWPGSMKPPSAVKTTTTGTSFVVAVFRSMIQVPTIGCPAMAAGVASWAEAAGPWRRGPGRDRRHRDRRGRFGGRRRWFGGWSRESSLRVAMRPGRVATVFLTRCDRDRLRSSRSRRAGEPASPAPRSDDHEGVGLPAAGEPAVAPVASRVTTSDDGLAAAVLERAVGLLHHPRRRRRPHRVRGHGHAQVERASGGAGRVASGASVTRRRRNSAGPPGKETPRPGQVVGAGDPLRWRPGWPNRSLRTESSPPSPPGRARFSKLAVATSSRSTASPGARSTAVPATTPPSPGCPRAGPAPGCRSGG